MILTKHFQNISDGATHVPLGGRGPHPQDLSFSRLRFLTPPYFRRFAATGMVCTDTMQRLYNTA